MRLTNRKVVDWSFTGLSLFSVLLLAAALLVILVPVFARGAGAYAFRGTVEHRRLLLERFGRGDADEVARELAQAREARKPAYDMLAQFEEGLAKASWAERSRYSRPLEEVRERLHALFGPLPGEEMPKLPRDIYGTTRWDRTQVELHALLNVEKYDYSDPTRMGTLYYEPRAKQFEGTALEPMFSYVAGHIQEMLLPRRTFYWGFLTDESLDIHLFGGIWAEVLGTLYLTLGAMFFAVPLGVIAAVYLVEYAPEGRIVSLLRSCISALAGVPSIVFGLFGLAFFINALPIMHTKCVLAGALTLALLVLPTVIRASEEAIRAVPQTYKEAALSIGAGRWRTIVTIILPAALPGILTGIVISMGRAAGETAPIIFTAAVSAGAALTPLETLTKGTPALPWNIYNLATEHEAVEQIRHVQYGMVMTLILLVLLLNAAAFVLRARISKKLRG